MNQIWRSKVTDHRSFCFWHITHGAIFLMRLKSVIYFLSHHFFLTSLTSSHSSTFTHSSLSYYFSLKFYLSSSTRPQSDLSHYAFSISPSFLGHVFTTFRFHLSLVENVPLEAMTGNRRQRCLAGVLPVCCQGAEKVPLRGSRITRGEKILGKTDD